MRILFNHIKAISGVLEDNFKPLRGKALGVLNQIEDAYLILQDGRIQDYGTMDQLPEGSFDQIHNLKNKFLLPAWCDSHTHIVFAAAREKEFEQRINGLSYEEIAKRGGGILNSAERLRNTSEEELFESAMLRMEEVAQLGTGAIEIKSGYGLNFDAELKMLRVIKRIKEESKLTVKANFLAAHAYPLEYRENHQGYIRIIIEEMLPTIADEGLADYIDAFCEFGFFSMDETSQILEAGAKYGLKGKIHANQLNFSGGVQVGVKHGAISVDHLECVGDEELELLKNSETIGTVLPSAAFFLGLHYQPARKMIDEGVALALASDYNPGSSPSGNMPFITSLACTQLKMSPAEAINACTINGAYAMELGTELGSISRGKVGNLIITSEIPSLAYIPYAFGSNCIERVIINKI